jgi:oligopeptide transport system substrate-binding protein
VRRGLWVGAAVATCTAVACNPPERDPRWRPAGATTPREGGTLRLALKDRVISLDPTYEYDEVSSIVAHAVFDTLVDYDAAQDGDEASGLRIVPRLAQRWDVSADGLTYRFTLRPGLAYSDGRAVVAADFKVSLERALSTPDSPFAAMLSDLRGAEELTARKAPGCVGIVAIDDRTLELQLSRPNAALLGVLTMTFTTPQRADHIADGPDRLRRDPLGVGPFVVASWDEGEQLVLARNPHYYDPQRAHLDRIVVRESIPRDSQFLMFERGELDAAERLAAPDYLWLIGQPAWQPYLHRRAMLNAYGSRMNVKVKPFDDRRVRQALNLALDKHHSAKLLNGTAMIAHGILPPGILGRDPDLAPYPHDPVRARALLAEAGYPNGFDTDYLIMADDEAERLALSLQADLREVGVRVRIIEMELGSFGTEIGKPDGAAFSKAAVVGDIPDPSNFLDTSFHSRSIATEASQNNAFYANPELDALLDAARAEPDPARRATAYRRAERILYDDAPWLWEYHQALTEVTQPYVRGFALHPVWSRDYTGAWLDVGPDGEPVPR